MKKNQIRSWIQEEAVKSQEVGIPRNNFIDTTMNEMILSGQNKERQIKYKKKNKRNL